MAHVGAHMRDATQDGPWAFLRFSPLTFASYAVLLGAVVALLVLSSPSFYDFVPAEKAARAPAAAEEAPGSPGAEDRKHFRLVVVGLVLNIITKGSIGCYETLGVSYAETNLQLSGPKTGMVVAGCGLLGVVFLLSFKALGKLFDDVELILYGIGVMVLSCLLMIRGIWSPLIGNDDVDAYAIWLTAMVSMYGVGPTRCRNHCAHITPSTRVRRRLSSRAYRRDRLVLQGHEEQTARLPPRHLRLGGVVGADLCGNQTSMAWRSTNQ